MAHDKLQILKASPFAREMGDAELKHLADLIDVRDLADGEILVEEGKTDPNLFVVVSGLVAVAKRTPDGDWNTLHVLGPGDFVGELSFMDDEPRYAALRAQGKTTVFSLNRSRFELLVPAHPLVAYKAMRAIMRVVHHIQRRLSMQMVELSHYIYKAGGKY
jgi:CRP-like cAMP-binding protein